MILRIHQCIPHHIQPCHTYIYRWPHSFSGLDLDPWVSPGGFWWYVLLWNKLVHHVCHRSSWGFHSNPYSKGPPYRASELDCWNFLWQCSFVSLLFLFWILSWPSLKPIQDNCILITPREDGSLKTTIYRKPTHTDLYLQWDSNHTITAKYGVVDTLHHRANVICSSPELLQQEEKHLHQALTSFNQDITNITWRIMFIEMKRCGKFFKCSMVYVIHTKLTQNEFNLVYNLSKIWAKYSQLLFIRTRLFPDELEWV